MLLYKNNRKISHCQHSSEIFAEKTNSKVKASFIFARTARDMLHKENIDWSCTPQSQRWLGMILLQRRTGFYFRLQGFVCCFSCAVDMAVWQIPTPFAWGHFHHYFKNLWILLQASRNSLFVLSLDMTLTSIFLAYFLFSLIFLQDWQKLAMKANIYIFCTICYIFRWSSFDWPVHFFHFRNFCSSTWSENRMGCHQRYLWLCRLRRITH